MSLYKRLLEFAEQHKCNTCKGHGAVNDAEPGDMYYRAKKCPDCNGVGLDRPIDSLVTDTIKDIHHMTVSDKDAYTKIHTIHHMCDQALGHKK